MRRLIPPAVVGVVALAAFALPSSALAESDCTYAAGQDVSQTVPVGSATLTVYADASGNDGGITGTAPVAAGACVDNVAPAAGFDGGLVEVGAGEDPAAGAADPGLIAGQPDAYAVIDGSDANSDPTGQSDGYVGLSNYETGGARTGDAQCTASGPNNGAAASSNSGGCVGTDGGPWVYMPGDLPTPVCGNITGNSFDGTGDEGAGNRDGCEQLEVELGG